MSYNYHETNSKQIETHLNVSENKFGTHCNLPNVKEGFLDLSERNLESILADY